MPQMAWCFGIGERGGVWKDGSGPGRARAWRVVGIPDFSLGLLGICCPVVGVSLAGQSGISELISQWAAGLGLPCRAARRSPKISLKASVLGTCGGDSSTDLPYH